MKNYLLKEYVSLTEEMADELIDNKIVMNSSDMKKLTFNTLINLNSFNGESAICLLNEISNKWNTSNYFSGLKNQECL